MTFAEDYKDELIESLENDIGQGVFNQEQTKSMRKLINWISHFEEIEQWNLQTKRKHTY